MQLSEAIILGDSLKRCNPWQWLSADGSCGCGFGGALLAAGVDANTFFGEMKGGSAAEVAEAAQVKARWPWLTATHLEQITCLYFLLTEGQRTIEDVADYVRSVEPGEPVSPQTEMEEKEMQVV